MHIVVETGQGLPDANSYIRDEDALRHLPSYYIDDWMGMDTDDRADRLIAASQFVDVSFQWVGKRKTLDQGLAWPRTGVVYQGHEVSRDMVPRAIVRACIMALVTVVTEGFDVFRSTGEHAVKREQLAVMSMEYFAPAEKAGYKSAYDDINNLLKGFYLTGQKGGVIVSQVLRA